MNFCSTPHILEPIKAASVYANELHSPTSTFGLQIGIEVIVVRCGVRGDSYGEAELVFSILFFQPERVERIGVKQSRLSSWRE